MMTRRDYIAIAAAIKRCGMRHGLTKAQVDIAHSVADIMADDNPKFDSTKFLAACGV